MKTLYITGSRADFGLMERTLHRLHAIPQLELGIVVTGQHLLKKYGETIDEVIVSGLPVLARIPVSVTGDSGIEMGRAFVSEMSGLLDTFEKERPDLVLVLGDRGEMLAATLAAIHCGIRVAHIHGGEVTGTLDESFRHAISKLAHYHFPATDDARERLIKMGENSDLIWTVGAPGLVGITDGTEREDGWLQKQFSVPRAAHSVLCVFHPVVQEASQARAQMNNLLAMLEGRDCSGIILRPNSDAGGREIDDVLDALSPQLAARFVVIDHLTRTTYLKCLANVDIMVGNSSSGIIESASFSISNLNIGNRQAGRLRNENTVDCSSFDLASLSTAFDKALALPRTDRNLYGDGKTDIRLAELLLGLPLDNRVLAKRNTY